MEQREDVLKKARVIAEAAKDGTFTTEQKTELDTLLAKADELESDIKTAQEDENRLARIAALGGSAKDGPRGGDVPDAPSAKSLGEHFVQHAGAKGLKSLRTTRGFQVDTGEDGWVPDGAKAATDPNTIGTSIPEAFTQIDRTIVETYRRPVVSDLLGVGAIGDGFTGVTYFVEGAVEGDFAMVGEAGQKPQIHFTNPTAVTDKLKKVAGWWDDSEEMLEDAAWLSATFNNRARYMIELFEEAQLLRGDGVGNNVLGLLNRSGIQEIDRTSGEPEQDAIFRAITSVETATGLSADGIVINPLDYQRIRLSKDGNGQYFGGGFFQGQYGNGVVADRPPLWGLRTVITPAAVLGIAIVGAFKAATAVFRRGGLRVVSTNSDAAKFTKDIITTRMEKRVGLAVRNPTAVVEVDLTEVP
jgi:HK97 family phage major capsid protein